MREKLTVATQSAYFLGESPVWDPIRERVLWVDILAGRAFSSILRSDGTLDARESVTVNESLGAVAVSRSGDWIMAGAQHLHYRTAAGDIRQGRRIVPPGGGSRLNDGGVDPRGRFVIGSLPLIGSSDSEMLCIIDHDGELKIVDDDLSLSNGLAWTSDGSTLYSVDSERRVVFRRRYDSATAECGPRETFIALEDGFPDGITIDAQDHLWLAIWGLGQVRRYTPTGRLDHVIEVPAPHTSSVAFAGRDLDTLVITTAQEDLTTEQREAYPLSGHIFTVRPGTFGQALPLWNGSPPPPHRKQGRS